MPAPSPTKSQLEAQVKDLQDKVSQVDSLKHNLEVVTAERDNFQQQLEALNLTLQEQDEKLASYADRPATSMPDPQTAAAVAQDADWEGEADPGYLFSSDVSNALGALRDWSTGGPMDPTSFAKKKEVYAKQAVALAAEVRKQLDAYNAELAELARQADAQIAAAQQ